MKEGIQTFCGEIGEAACYALSILKLAERELLARGQSAGFDVLAALGACIDRGFVYYNSANAHDNDNFYVEKPGEMFEYLTGIPCRVRKAAADYVPAKNERTVQRWERIRTGTVTGHFRLPDWDSLCDSQTVKYGKLVSLRVFALRG